MDRRDLDKHELLNRIFEYHDKKIEAIDNELKHTLNFYERSNLLNQQVALGRVVCDIVDIIKTYDNELNGDIWQTMDEVFKSLKSINEKGGE